MPLNGISLMSDSTGISVIGGATTAFDSDGSSVSNGVHLVDNSEANFLLRPHLTFKNRAYAKQSDDSFSKGLRSVVTTLPITLADGSISYQVSRQVFEIHPEATQAQINELRRLTAQTIIDDETDDFYFFGSV